MTSGYDSIGSIPTEVLGIDSLSFPPFLVVTMSICTVF